MAMLRLLVTGGCGFIGSNFIRHLLQSEVTVVDRLLNFDKLTYAGNRLNLADLTDARLHFEQGDIGDRARVSQLLSEHKINALLHFAAETHVDRSIDDPEPFAVTNALGTFRLLEAARSYWKNLPAPEQKAFRFIHVSTDEVFGALPTGAMPFEEEAPFGPNNPYAASKAAGDHFARAAFHTYGMPVLITRSTNNYGPYQFPEKLIPLMLLNALDGRPLPIYGDGLHQRDWLHVSDHCRALEKVFAKGTPGQTYHIAGGNLISNLELVRELCHLLDILQPRADHRSYLEQITHVPDRPDHDRCYALATGKIRGELGWTPKENFESGLTKTVEWYRDHTPWAALITAGFYNRERLGSPTP